MGAYRTDMKKEKTILEGCLNKASRMFYILR